MTDRRQARILVDPRSAAFIHPFLARERSTAEASSEAGCSISTMAYRIRVLRDAGLLQLTRTARRADRPVNYYRSSHDAYHVPLGVTGFADQAEQTRRIGAPIHRRLLDAYSSALAGSGVTTRVIARDDHGGIFSTDLPPHRTSRHNPLLFEDRTMHLTHEQAEWLCARLDELFTELATDRGAPETATQPYLVMTAAIPVETR